MAVLLMTLLKLLALKHVDTHNLTSRNNILEEFSFELYNTNLRKTTPIINYTLPKTITPTPVKIIIPDWSNSSQCEHINQMQEAMSRKNRWHVITFDWSKPQSQSRSQNSEIHLKSEQAERLTCAAISSAHLTNFTIELIRTNQIPFRWVHFIGHGLGALIAIQAAYQVTAHTGKRISRITALDPTLTTTLTSLTSKGDYDKLKHVAKFVDVIHTNAGELGTFEPFGHVDFYPNGGKLQPGCGNNSLCNHNRACEYWSASMVNAHCFRAFNIKLWKDYIKGNIDKLSAQPMGVAANPSMPWGPYLVETRDGPPYVLPKHYFKYF